MFLVALLTGWVLGRHDPVGTNRGQKCAKSGRRGRASSSAQAWWAGHHPGAGDANGSLGTRHDEKASWTYHDDDTRQDAIDKAEDWLRDTKRRICDTPELAVQADAQESSITVRQLIADYADD